MTYTVATRPYPANPDTPTRSWVFENLDDARGKVREITGWPPIVDVVRAITPIGGRFRDVVVEFT